MVSEKHALLKLSLFDLATGPVCLERSENFVFLNAVNLTKDWAVLVYSIKSLYPTLQHLLFHNSVMTLFEESLLLASCCYCLQSLYYSTLSLFILQSTSFAVTFTRITRKVSLERGIRFDFESFWAESIKLRIHISFDFTKLCLQPKLAKESLSLELVLSLKQRRSSAQPLNR